MKATKEIKNVKVVVKNLTSMGASCLHDIKGLTEGTIIEGRFNPANNAVDFKWNGNDAVLWVGENCQICESKKKATSARVRLSNAIRSLVAPGERRALRFPVPCPMDWNPSFTAAFVERSKGGVVGISDKVFCAPYMKELSEDNCEQILAAL